MEHFIKALHALEDRHFPITKRLWDSHKRYNYDKKPGFFQY